MVKLGVNIDHVATLRQARRALFPDPVEAALLVEKAGGDGITVHLREDRRHIQDSDVKRLKERLRTKLNLEMSCAPAIVSLACSLMPEDACLVPEKREELTTEGGLNVCSQKNRIEAVVSRLQGFGIRVSIFVDPETDQVTAAHEVGADCVELHTGAYAEAKSKTDRKRELLKLVRAAEQVGKLGLILNAGHGLDYENVTPVARINNMNELNIGFSIIARSLFVGLERAVQEMKSLIQ